MQLKPRKSGLRTQLTLAAASLLTATSMNTVQAKNWTLETGVLAYKETNRVTAVEPKISYSHFFSGDKTFRFEATYDSLTGASHNGASPSTKPVTFTRPSGNGAYTIGGGEVPLDDTFRDSRYALSTSWSQPIARNHTLSLGISGSKEFDFFSTTGSVRYAVDLFEKNTTLAFGASYEADEITPKGKIPIPLAEMAAPGDVQPRGARSETKSVTDFLLGLTQVINKNFITQINYSLSRSKGYMTDPFKIVSVIDAAPGPNQGEPLKYIYENRPDSRTKHSVYLLAKYHLPRDVVSGSFRFYTDDWGVTSHTLNLDYQYNIDEQMYLKPSLRYYFQSEAEFYRHSIKNSEAIPNEVSADQRLAAFHAITPGLQFGYKMENEHSWSVRVQYYRQTGESNPANAIGVQKELDLFPSLNAYILQILYTI